jgi:hypothetical protein
MPAFILKLILCFLPGFALALNISHNQTGQAIIVPYYTVKNNLNTYVTLTNTTDKIKAVKLSFQESHLGIDLMNVNAYILPHETYVFGMAPIESSIEGHEGEDSVAIYQAGDVVCTPFLDYIQEFKASQLDSQLSDNNINFGYDLSAAREGMIHIIEMGTLEPNSGYGPNIRDRNCDAIETLWAEGGTWNNDPTHFVQAPSGGLRATTSIIDVTNGFQFAVDNIAIDNFFAEDADLLHTAPGEVSAPTLADAQNKYQGFTYASGIHSLGALLAKTSIYSDFIKSTDVNSVIEWVVTLPLNRFMELSYYDCLSNSVLTIYKQNGDKKTLTSGGLGAPLPPGPRPGSLCSTINIISTAPNSNSILGSTYFHPNSYLLEYEYQYIDNNINGYTQIDINDLSEENQLIGHNQHETRTTHGAPVMGFSITRMQNNNAQPGLLATFATSQSLFYQSDSTTTPIED